MLAQSAQVDQIQNAIFTELGTESGCRIYLYGAWALGPYDRFEPVLLAIESPNRITADLIGHLQMVANQVAEPLSVHLTEYNSMSPESQWQVHREGVELLPISQRLYKQEPQPGY